MSPQPMSRESVEKKPRIRDADNVVGSGCPYCAVGCSQLIYVKNKRIIDIEGNPASPINEGTLCPKGAATYQYVVNPNRVTTVRYRAAHSDHWEDRPLEWAMDRIATLIKKTRDATFVERTAGDELRPRWGAHLPARPCQRRCHPDHGQQHGREPPRRLSLADEGP